MRGAVIRRTCKKSILITFLVLVCSPQRARADEEFGAAVQIDAEARRVLHAFSKYHTGLKGMRLRLEEQKEILLGDVVAERKAQTGHLTAERPKKLIYIGYRASETNPKCVVACDGDVLSVSRPSKNWYATVEAPKNWKQILRLPTIQVAIGTNPVIKAILDANPVAKLLDGMQTVKYGGIVNLKDRECHLIEAFGKHHDWRLWVQKGDRPIVVRFARDDAKFFARMAKEHESKPSAIGMRLVVTLDDWEENPQFAADEFAFKVPEGAEKVASVSDLLPEYPLSEPPIDQKAQRVLDSFDDYLGGLKGFRIKCVEQSTTDGVSDGPAISASLAAERPNRLAYRYPRETLSSSMACDGKTMATSVRLFDKSEQYASDAPESLNQFHSAKTFLRALVGPIGQHVFLKSLLSDNPTADIFGYDSPKSIKYMGEAKYRGRMCHVIEATMEDPASSWEYYYDATGANLLRGFTITKVTATPNEPKQQVSDELWLEEWEVNPRFDDDTFKIQPVMEEPLGQ